MPKERSHRRSIRWGLAAWLQVAAVIAIVVILHVPLGNYMAAVYTSGSDFRVRGPSTGCGRAARRPATLDKVPEFAIGLSVASVLVLYALLLLQVNAPEPCGHKGLTPALAFNTAISFTTNTSWQNYPGESTLGHIGSSPGSASRLSQASP